MACDRLGNVVSPTLMCRPINTVPATRTPQNDSDGNALEFLSTSVVRIDRIIVKISTLTYQESMQPTYLTFTAHSCKKATQVRLFRSTNSELLFVARLKTHIGCLFLLLHLFFFGTDSLIIWSQQILSIC